jgi:glucose/arabinose dehydrogenase
MRLLYSIAAAGVLISASVWGDSNTFITHQQRAGERAAGAASGATPLTRQLIVSSGVDAPVLVTHAPNDSDRIFIVDQDGQIWIHRLDSATGVLSRPFLNISTRLLSGGERGLLGLAFHPNYASNGYFYVNYTDNTGGDTRIARYTVSSDPDSALFTSEVVLMEIDQPFSNHNGGMIAFGDDGYLYIGMGDGGDGGDPQDRAQNPLELLGKMLRIDVDNHPTPPPDNPYVGNPDTSQYIWAMGVRNPWRFSFDRLTYDMYIADVGQGTWEEIDIEPTSSTGKYNYGWDNREGKHCYEPMAGCITAGMTDPVHEYNHTGGNCSISGGYVYRGCAIPDLDGAYFFGDYCSGKIWSFKYVGGVVTQLTDRTVELNSTPFSVVGFGEDVYGEIYICDLSGDVYKIVPNGVPSQCSVPSCCTLRGNVNNMGGVTVSDLTYLVQFLFNGGAAPSCLEQADANGVGGVTVADLSYLVAFLFNAGAPPPAC